MVDSPSEWIVVAGCSGYDDDDVDLLLFLSLAVDFSDAALVQRR